jgi:hypothetical protein
VKTWTVDELATFGDAGEVRVAGMRRDGTLRKPVIVWVVRVGDDLYTRSVNGPDAAWFRGTRARRQGQITTGNAVADIDFVDVNSADADGATDDEIDAAYQRKYGRYPGPVGAITSPKARSTTQKLLPHQSG